MKDPLKIGDIVKHFKYEFCTDSEKLQNKYLYRIEGFATDADDLDTDYVVYRSLYPPFKLWVRKYSEFFEYVDRTSFPDIKQETRYEVVDVNRYIDRSDRFIDLDRILSELPLTRSSRSADQKIIN